MLVGGLGTLAVVQLLRGVVTELAVTSPTAWVVVPLGLGVITVAAALVPARRATAIDPMEALRAD